MKDGKLVFEQVVPNAFSGEGEPVGVVFFFVPPRSEPDLDAPLAHVVDLGDQDREGPDGPEGYGRYQSPEADRTGVPGQPGQCRPGVGVGERAGCTPDFQVVIGAEEAVEATLLGRKGRREKLLVGRSLLRLSEDPH